MTVPVVAVVGIGGLGCPAVHALAASGEPLHLRLLDEDRVERTNLHRQTLFCDTDIGSLKVTAAARAVVSRWPGVQVEAVPEHVAPDNALRLLTGATVVVEGTDNLSAKFLVGDVARRLRVAVVHGACVGWQGTVLPVAPDRGACYRCVFESVPPGEDACTCATAGVYGPATAVLGALMAADVLRLLRGDFSTVGSLARYHGWQQTFRASTFRRRPGCPTCSAVSEQYPPA